MLDAPHAESPDLLKAALGPAATHVDMPPPPGPSTLADTSGVQWVIRPGPPVDSVYDLGETLGQGSFGVVHAATHRTTGQAVAVKSIRKSLLRPEDVGKLRREVEILHHLAGHPNISQLLGVHEDPTHLHLVLELYQGGDLYDAIVTTGRHSERAAADMMRVVLGAMSYCHAMGVAHRDIKPENFMLTAPAAGEKSGPASPSAAARLKLIDFGLSVFCADSTPLSEVVGTSYYVAPEVLDRCYGRAADIWSCGIILHVLLVGCAPFNGTGDEEIVAAVREGRIDWSLPMYASLSPGAVAVLAAMLDRDPARRATADELLAAPWLGRTPSDCTAPSEPLPGVVSERLRAFARLDSFAKEARRVVAGLMRQEEVAGLVAAFKDMDADGDGKLSLEELKEGLARQELRLEEWACSGGRPPLMDTELAQLVQMSDLNGDGQLDQSEFLAVAVPAAAIRRHSQQAVASALASAAATGLIPGSYAARGSGTGLTRRAASGLNPLEAAFAHFDADGSGYITADELRAALAEHHPQGKGPDVEELIRHADVDSDGRISYPEFIFMMLSAAEGGPAAAAFAGLSTAEATQAPAAPADKPRPPAVERLQAVEAPAVNPAVKVARSMSSEQPSTAASRVEMPAPIATSCRGGLALAPIMPGSHVASALAPQLEAEATDFASEGADDGDSSEATELASLPEAEAEAGEGDEDEVDEARPTSNGPPSRVLQRQQQRTRPPDLCRTARSTRSAGNPRTGMYSRHDSLACSRRQSTAAWVESDGDALEAAIAAGHGTESLVRAPSYGSADSRAAVRTYSGNPSALEWVDGCCVEDVCSDACGGPGSDADNESCYGFLLSSSRLLLLAVDAAERPSRLQRRRPSKFLSEDGSATSAARGSGGSGERRLLRLGPIGLNRGSSSEGGALTPAVPRVVERARRHTAPALHELTGMNDSAEALAAAAAAAVVAGLTTPGPGVSSSASAGLYHAAQAAAVSLLHDTQTRSGPGGVFSLEETVDSLLKQISGIGLGTGAGLCFGGEVELQSGCTLTTDRDAAFHNLTLEDGWDALPAAAAAAASVVSPSVARSLAARPPSIQVPAPMLGLAAPVGNRRSRRHSAAAVLDSAASAGGPAFSCIASAADEPETERAFDPLVSQCPEVGEDPRVVAFGLSLSRRLRMASQPSMRRFSRGPSHQCSSVPDIPVPPMQDGAAAVSREKPAAAAAATTALFSPRSPSSAGGWLSPSAGGAPHTGAQMSSAFNLRIPQPQSPGGSSPGAGNGSRRFRIVHPAPHGRGTPDCDRTDPTDRTMSRTGSSTGGWRLDAESSGGVISPVGGGGSRPELSRRLPPLLRHLGTVSASQSPSSLPLSGASSPRVGTATVTSSRLLRAMPTTPNPQRSPAAPSLCPASVAAATAAAAGGPSVHQSQSARLPSAMTSTRSRLGSSVPTASPLEAVLDEEGVEEAWAAPASEPLQYRYMIDPANAAHAEPATSASFAMSRPAVDGSSGAAEGRSGSAAGGSVTAGSRPRTVAEIGPLRGLLSVFSGRAHGSSSGVSRHV
ncbi:hypothetical protein HYH03_008593 [Edaphochlamys debaryana]|uniref:Uncharacterized protein n=1 Tax=Edaphochlamys debaryana TaxID=47281 RepID=A0A835XZN1_9CHLO|nr:hypothetical protein HYH03_008593 [Edaphochlamys debaryana]|eukprot:KAG2493171.1 hypothetical protein HYH03_008593 [Edaphochlamys debaryana]